MQTRGEKASGSDLTKIDHRSASQPLSHCSRWEKKVFNANKLLCVNRTGLLKIPIYSNKMHKINKIFKRDMFYISQFS